MDNEEKVLNPQESLRVIRETIDLAKSSLRENGFHFLLWGWLVVLTCAVHYYLVAVAGVDGKTASMSWLGMTFVGAPVALIYEWRREKKQRAPNLVRDWYGRVWLGFGVSLFLAIFLAVMNGLSPIPFILVLVAFATFVSGTLLRFRPLIFGAAAVWACALACTFLTPSEQLLAEAVAVVLGYLIPGYLLNARSRHV